MREEIRGRKLREEEEGERWSYQPNTGHMREYHKNSYNYEAWIEY
jgi:hypothetical protein